MFTLPNLPRLKRPAKNSARERVTLRTIAQAAKVSLMTVSYALRNNPQVSRGEQQRIQKIAEKLGYRPDPLLTHLMQHLRSHRTLKSTTNLAVLTMLDAGFVRRLLQGARARAERLGYHLDVIDVRMYADRSASLTRTLFSRGISGVLLAPTVAPANYARLLDWDKFAAVAMTYSIVEPHVHRVVTHHFDNAVRTFALLEQRGLRRIGLAMTRDMEFRANHSYSGAYWRVAETRNTRSVPIIFLDATSPKEIRSWFATHRPHAVVVANAHQVRDFLLPALGKTERERTIFVTLDYEPAGGIPGMDQLFEMIGSHAIDALVAQLHRNERGLPEHPTITMVEGQWVDHVKEG